MSAGCIDEQLGRVKSVFQWLCIFVSCLFVFLSVLLSKVFWQLGERLGRVKSELEEISILAEFCAQVQSEG